MLPPVAVRQQPPRVAIEFLAGLDGEFRIRPFHDGVNGTGLLTEAAVDALDHVDVVARGAASAVIAAGSGFNRDRLGRADCLAELAGDTAILAGRVAPQGMFA